MVKLDCMLSVHLFKDIFVVYISGKFLHWSLSVVDCVCWHCFIVFWEEKLSGAHITARLEQSNASAPASFPALLFPTLLFCLHLQVHFKMENMYMLLTF